MRVGIRKWWHRGVGRIFVFGAVLTVVLAASVPTAQAHTGDQSYLYLDIGETLVARLQMPYEDVDAALGITIEGTDSQKDRAIDQAAPALREYASSHVQLGTGDEMWTLTPTTVDRLEDADYVQVLFDVDHGPDVPQEMVATLDPFFDEVDNRDALLIIANDWNRGVVDNEAEHLLRFTPGERTISFDLGDGSNWNNFTASISTGLDHIRTGPDHMLFILALMLPSVLVWKNGWQPASGFGSTLWKITKVMTMFTLAHSVTFSLTGLGWVPSPGARTTETIIALSIAATAAHSLKPIFGNREWLIAFVFGLFHGFGFASLIQELDVSTTTQLISLAGRNVGIEVGQLIVVVLTFPALFLLRTTRAYRPFLIVGSIGLIIVSIGWALERLFDVRRTTSRVMDELVQFPRVLVLIVLVTAVAAAIHLRERSEDRLLTPVG